MSVTCKKHGKPKDQSWMEKQSHGGSIERFGCVDCRTSSAGKSPAGKPKVKLKSPINPRTIRRLLGADGSPR
jgi:hypothetical protein